MPFSTRYWSKNFYIFQVNMLRNTSEFEVLFVAFWLFFLNKPSEHNLTSMALVVCMLTSISPGYILYIFIHCSDIKMAILFSLDNMSYMS